jgi:signal transduction histidine kinase
VKHRAQLLPGLPVVFCAVEAAAVDDHDLDAGIRGIRTRPEWGATLEAARQLHPGTSRVVVVSGTSELDRALRTAASRELERYGQGVEIAYLSDQPIERLVDEAAGLPKGTIILYVSLLRDAAGRPFNSADALALLAQASNAPIYGASEAYLGRGIVGGRLIDHSTQGVRAGELAARILRGEPPESLPIIDEGATAYVFDGRELRRWGISETRLPPGSIVRYQDPSRWALQRWRLVGGGALVLSVALLATGLVLQWKGRRRAEASLAEGLRFETLAAEVSAPLIHVPLSGLDVAIERELHRVVEFLGVDRAGLDEYMPGREIARLSWAAEGVAPRPEIVEGVHRPWTIEQFERGRHVQFSRLDELPPEAAADRRSYQAAGTRSCLALPLVNGGALLGALSFEAVRGEHAWRDDLVERLQLLREVFAGVLERKRAEVSLDEQLRFETLLSEQSAAFSRVGPADVDRQIERALRQIVDFLQVDRGSLAEFASDSQTARVTHEWVTEGAEPAPSALALGELPWVVARLGAGEVVRFSQLADLPEDDASVDRRTYARLGITSQIEVPLMVEGTVVGALAFTALGTGRVWRDEILQRLRLLGEVFANVLSRRRSETEALRLRQELAHVGRISTLGELTASLAHELNQPLTAILSNTEAAQRILESDPTRLGEVREILQDIIDADRRASEVIHRIRGLLKRDHLEFTALDLNEVVGEVAQLVRADAAVRGVSIHLEVAAGLPMVRGDRVHIQQVLLNLILNGLDAMRASTTSDRVLVLRTVRDGPGTVRLAVRDSGVGIDQADLDHVFDAFYTTKPNGIGMGLAIARSIVQAHGGRLEAENNPDAGATFSFTLPIGTDGS